MAIQAGLRGLADVFAGRDAAFAARLDRLGLGARLMRAFAVERDERRLFLWVPVAAGTGVFLYLAADREPVLWMPVLLLVLTAGLAVAARGREVPFALAIGAIALVAGFVSAELRTRRVAAPVLDRIRISRITGFVEEVDPRPAGARFVVRVRQADGLDPGRVPARVRLTTKRADPLEAGQFVSVTARLLPPARAAMPGGYDFARDAFFAGLGSVGSALGRIAAVPAPEPPGLLERTRMWLDRARNTLAARVDATVGGGDVGAVAAAMVTGKRDRLSQDGRDIIRQAGIFHIITIAGVQMTLVAALLFGIARRLLALSPTLALRHPIKKWAAAVAIVGAVGYDLATGSRIGTQRALFMTLIVLGAILVDRRALTMRNLAIAALAVIAVEPEAIAGASFQLSFAAVAALVAVQEARMRRPAAEPSELPAPRAPPAGRWMRHGVHVRDKVAALMIATVGATLATASFMAGAFHELSPYVFVGNPLTLAMIEFFAVPGALLGTFLYPLGLDAPVWHWVGWGIRFVFWVARFLAAAPGATLHVRAFAPWALPCLALAVLSVVIWRTTTLRLTAVPLLLLGLAGAASGPRPEMVVAPTGDAVAIRGEDGSLGIVGRSSAFTAEQWLRADGDGREAAPSAPGSRCDKLACVAPVPGGQTISVVADAAAFEEDCGRADIIVTRLWAPKSCAAELIVDRGTLEDTGALALTRRNGGWVPLAARAPGEDRPWSPAPPARHARPAFRPAASGQGTSDDPADGQDGEPVRLP